jgi:anti-sigma B factor antagonist
LAIASRNVSGVFVVRLKGRITMGDGSVQTREAIRESIDNGQTRILLDHADVNYIDSSGLGELVAAYTTARNRGAQLN